MLSQADLTAYRRDGFIVLPDVLARDEVDALRRVTDGFVRDSRMVAANDEVYDLEDTHSAAAPRVRRIKTPHAHAPSYWRASRHPAVIEPALPSSGTAPETSSPAEAGSIAPQNRPSGP